ncbi:MAG: ABC transporter permease [Acidobacteriaceae bacterium]
MHNIFLIARREYLERVRTKAFILSTILIPVFMIGASILPAYMATRGSSEKEIAIVSADSELGSLVQQQLQANDQKTKVSADLFEPLPGIRKRLTKEVQDKKLDGYLWLTFTGDKSAAPRGEYFSRSAGDLQFVAHLQDVVHDAFVDEHMKQHGVQDAEAKDMMTPVNIDLRQVDRGSDSNSLSTFAGAFALMLLLYMTVLVHGINVGRSIIEEKNSRVFEVLLSIIKPDEMLAGKILGVGSVGLTQIAIWIGAGVALAGSGLVMAATQGDISLHLSPVLLIAFALCFILGFIFYSALAAMLGAMVNSEQEMQQLNLFVVLPLVACMVMMGYVISNPSSWLSVLMSLFPPTAPLIMYLRIAIQTPPLWQIALSLVLMLAGVYLAIWIASRIYRVGILMYGKRPSLPEMLRWLKYS